MTPATHIALRGNGADAWPGWPNSPKLEELRQAWFDATDLGAQQKIGQEMQRQAFIDVPYIPLGFYLTPHRLPVRPDRLRPRRPGILERAAKHLNAINRAAHWPTGVAAAP